MFNDDGVKAFGDIITDYKNNLWCKYSDVEQLQARIKELESDAHINEIKARAIEEAVEEAAIDCNVTDGPVIVLEKVRNYADKLRGNQ